jgi:hypothetical protein
MLSPRDYYHGYLKRLYRFVIPKGNKVLYLKNEDYSSEGTYDYIVLEDMIGDLKDIQLFLEKIKKNCHSQTRVVTTYYNHLWEPVLKLASHLGLRAETGEQNWLDNGDIANFFELAGFEVVTKQKKLLLPLDLPVISDIVNKWIANMPVVNNLCLSTWIVCRPKPLKRLDYSVSIIIPARNESGNIERALKELPRFGKSQEVIFVEGHSKDDTWDKIQQVTSKNDGKKFTVKSYRQKGIGKADAVRLGFKKATGEILMILDADLTVSPKELPKFYEALSTGKGEYINGCRLIYPMEKEAMRTLNKMGNIVFSWLFTWILGQRIKDTLCGTKVLLKTDYEKIVKNRSFFGDFDPFGDYDLIFGAIKQNLKMVEIPIRYKERTYGSTNISRFRHGWLLLRMTAIGFKRFRSW